MRVALAQTKPVTGDLEGNVRQIIEDIRKAKQDQADIILFPETAITGYCCGALFEQEEFIAYNKAFLEEIIVNEVPEDLVAVIGFVDYKGRRADGHLDITNSVAVIQDQKMVDVYDKVLLANGNHHEDKKYFTPGKEVKVTDVTIQGKKVKIGTPICEDAWNADHTRDIVQEMKDLGAELILCPNQSYFYYGKLELRRDLFSAHAREKNIPVVAVNAAGIGDIVKNILIYDGGSMAFNADGQFIHESPRFASDYSLVDLASKPIVASFSSKYEEIFNALVFEQQEIFGNVGIPNAQVHVSGGIDSAIAAAIVATAMGPEHSVFISNPTKQNGTVTKSNAQYIADQLGVKLHWNSTQEPYDAAVNSHTRAFGEEPTDTGKGCMQAVLRSAQGVGAYHTFKSGIVATGNHTEIVLGWATFHDIGSIGVHAPIGDLTKLELYQFAEYINGRLGKEVIPSSLYNGTTKPMAELVDADEDPIDYNIMSGICAEIIRNRRGINDLVGAYINKTLTPDFFPDVGGNTVYENYSRQEFTDHVLDAYKKSQQSVFKSAQGAPIVILSPRSRGFSNRETIINRYQGWYNLKEFRAEVYNGLSS